MPAGAAARPVAVVTTVARRSFQRAKIIVRSARTISSTNGMRSGTRRSRTSRGQEGEEAREAQVQPAQELLDDSSPPERLGVARSRVHGRDHREKGGALTAGQGMVVSPVRGDGDVPLVFQSVGL